MALELKSLDETLDRLLHHRSFREAFRNGRAEVTAEVRSALATLDLDALDDVAEQVLTDLLRRQHRGSGTLLTLFPRTLAAWQLTHPGDEALRGLFSRFMESAAYQAHREVPHVGIGACLEEAFFRFCEAERIGDPVVREEEFIAAIVLALAVTPRPTFRVPPEVVRLARGWAAVARLGEPMLHAVVDGRLISGRVTAFLAALVLGEGDPQWVAARHRVSAAGLAEALHQLAVLGLRVV